MIRSFAKLNTSVAKCELIGGIYFALSLTADRFVFCLLLGATRFASTSVSTNYGSTDGAFEKDRIHKRPGDETTRDFTYFMLGNARFIYASTARLALIKFVASMSASADVLALASAEFEIGSLPEGSTMTVKWRGKPVFIRHRTADEVAKEEAVSLSVLKDPQNDKDRVQESEWYSFDVYRAISFLL